jgi:hypothetical protein
MSGTDHAAEKEKVAPPVGEQVALLVRELVGLKPMLASASSQETAEIADHVLAIDRELDVAAGLLDGFDSRQNAMVAEAMVSVASHIMQRTARGGVTTTDMLAIQRSSAAILRAAGYRISEIWVG